jgi:uncharacterized protein YrrD
MKRPYQTVYFDSQQDYVRGRPAAMGFAASFHGARRCMAVHLVLGGHVLAVVNNRITGQMVSFMRRTTSGITIDDAKGGGES